MVRISGCTNHLRNKHRGSLIFCRDVDKAQKRKVLPAIGDKHGTILILEFMLLAVYAAGCEAPRTAENGICLPALPLLSYPALVMLVQVRVKELGLIFLSQDLFGHRNCCSSCRVIKTR